MSAHTTSDVLNPSRKAGDSDDSSLNEAASKVRSFVDKGRRKAGEIGDGMQDFVQTKPLQSILIAAGAGLVLGYLFGRRR